MCAQRQQLATPITIAGTNLGLTTSVIFTPPGGSATTIVPAAVAATQITATIPASSLTNAGTAQIAVQNSFGTLSQPGCVHDQHGTGAADNYFRRDSQSPFGHAAVPDHGESKFGRRSESGFEYAVGCTVSGGTATLVATGFCSITAMQAGNASYVAAMLVTRSFDVTAAVAPSGTLVATPGTPIAPGVSPRFLVAGDFNRDGVQDVAIAIGGESKGIAVLLGVCPRNILRILAG